MRKFILLAFILFSILFETSAQITPGAVYPELNIGKRFKYYHSNRIETGISIGLDKHSTLGFSHTFSRFNTFDFGSNTILPGLPQEYMNNNRFALNYNYFHYFGKKNKWGWYVNASVGLTDHKAYQKTGSTYEFNRRIWEKDLTIVPGVFFQPSSKLMLFANIGGFTASSSRNNLTFNTEFARQLNVGLRINLGKIFKKK